MLKFVRVGSILKIKNLCESFWTAQSEKLARVLSEDVHTGTRGFWFLLDWCFRCVLSVHTSIHRTPVLYTLQLSMIGYFWYNVSYSLLLFCFVSTMAKIRVICYITTICWNSNCSYGIFFKCLFVPKYNAVFLYWK